MKSRPSSLKWNGEVISYTPWKRNILEELNTLDFNKDEKISFVLGCIQGKNKYKIQESLSDCYNIDELFLSLDAENSSIYEALQSLRKDLNNLPSLPAQESQENHNIQKLLRYIRIIRKNEMNLPINFALDYANKLSRENHERLIEMENNTSDLDDADSLSKLLYKIQAVNVRMMASAPERQDPVVRTKEKFFLAPKKKIIKSKLSRIRRKFYLNRDENTALIYINEVKRFVRSSKMRTHEQNRWKQKIEQTYDDIRPLVDAEDNPKDDETFLQEILDIPDENEDVPTEMDASKNFAEKQAFENPINNGEQEEKDKSLHIGDEDIDLSLNLPSVPEEDPGQLHFEDEDETLNNRLQELKRERISWKKKEKIALTEVHNMSQPAGAKNASCDIANLKYEACGNTVAELHPVWSNPEMTVQADNFQPQKASNDDYELSALSASHSRPVSKQNQFSVPVETGAASATASVSEGAVPKPVHDTKPISANPVPTSIELLTSAYEEHNIPVTKMKQVGEPEETHTYVESDREPAKGCLVDADLNKVMKNNTILLLMMMMMMMMMVLTESVKKITTKIKQPPEKCSKDTGEALHAERFEKFTFWLVRALLWTKGRMKNTLSWTINCLEMLKRNM